MNNSENPLILGLTEEQSKAVTWPGKGRLRIAAGAGSGKTEVLTRRIAGLLDSGIRADELVAITYTQKAAAEMKARLVERRKLDPALLRDMEVSTFHAFLSRVLRQDPFGAGLDRSDTVIAENNRQLIMRELVDKFAEMFGERIIDSPQGLGANVAMKLINEFPAALGKVRRYLLKPGDFYQLAKNLIAARSVEAATLEKNCLEWLFHFYNCYLEELKRRGLLDFDEILIRSRDLIKDMRKAGSLPDHRVFLIDEFQDNNPDQLDIVNLFCRDRESHITVVGDEKQSIYRFQGANIETFRNFDSDQDIILSDNFRSYREILTLADKFLELGGNTGRMSAPQTAQRGVSPRKHPVNCLLHPQDASDSEVCAELAEMICNMAGSGMRITDRKAGIDRALRYGDIAIIVSSISNLPRQFEDALAIRQIPYIMSGGFSFYARSEIEEILAFLRLLVQPEDDHAVIKILSGPLYGLNDNQLAEFAMAGRNEKTALLPHLLAQTPELLPLRARQLRELFVLLKERATRPGLLDLCHFILEQAGFYEYAAAQSSELKRRRMENNLAKFLGIVRNFEQNGIFTSLRDFLSYIERILTSDIDEDEAGLGLEEGDALKIMTIHKSKGLEFPVVICPFLKRRHYRATTRIYFDREYGLMVNDPSQPGRKGAPPILEKYLDEDRQASEDEDRRKLYVAFTRAEDILIVTGSEELSLPPEKENSPAEPLHEVRRLIEENPELGLCNALPEWRCLLDHWLAYGRNEVEAVAVEASPPPDPGELESSIRHISAFLSQIPTTRIQESSSQEIFSLQDIRLFKTCPRRYLFTSRHVTSFHERQPSFYGTLGTLVHECIRLYHAQGGHLSENPDLDRNRVLGILDTLIPCYGEAGREAAIIARGIVLTYTASPLGKSEPWQIEAEVNVKFEGNGRPFFVRGFADRVDRSDNEVSIIDFKTRKYSAEAHAGYSDQLALYRIAASRGVLGELGCLSFSRSFIAYLTYDDVKVVEIEPDLPSFEADIEATVAAIRNETVWRPVSGSACEDCGFSVLCHGAFSGT
ncbi:MAG: ATP-dependent helicase [Candidatus Riflebacteria bacterium]|nr:ATP-dependent helicase [Candidatus Riflebacteria bacterium]